MTERAQWGTLTPAVAKWLVANGSGTTTEILEGISGEVETTKVRIASALSRMKKMGAVKKQANGKFASTAKLSKYVASGNGKPKTARKAAAPRKKQATEIASLSPVGTLASGETVFARADGSLVTVTFTNL